MNDASTVLRPQSLEGRERHHPEAERLSADQMLAQARRAIEQGEARQAREALSRLLRQNPDHVVGWFEAAELSHQLGRTQEALTCLRRVVQLAPSHWRAWLALARELEAQGQWDEAAACYHRALPGAGRDEAGQVVPGGVRKAHTLMAQYRMARGDAARALESVRQALGLLRVEQPEPDVNEQASLQIDLGDVLMRLGLTDDAHRAYERASRATDEAVLTRLAMQSFHQNLWHEAQQVLLRSVALHPDSATAHWNLAHAYAEGWQLEEAQQALSRAEALAPQPGAKSMRASIAGRLGDADLALALYRELSEQEGPLSAMRSSAAMSSLYSDSLSAQQVADLHRELFAQWGVGARTLGSFTLPQEPDRRIKLGLISADFHHQHPVNIFMQPVLARLNRQRFEVCIYHVGKAFDDQTQLAQRRSDRWVCATDWAGVRLARRILDDGIDVLIDLAGHTSNNRLALLAQRIAPVQVSFLGYPGSTGVPNVDWLLADATVVPPQHDVLCTERVYRLPHTVFCYSPEADYPYPRYSAEMATRPLTFGSFNNVPKLTPRTIALWSQILRALPQSRLVLKAPSFGDESAIKVFRERFAQQGITPDRLDFRGPVGLADMMNEYADIDIALDPVPYNGGTTTMQALWMGVPVVVMEGHNFVSRMGASFMRAAGLPDWVAADDAGYVQTALRQASDRAGLLALKASLRQRLQQSPAWDIDTYVRDIEAALQTMWSEYVHAQHAEERT